MTLLKTTLLITLFSVILPLNEDTIVIEYNNAARLSEKGNYEQAWKIYANLLKEPELPDTMLC